jgi:hypothetical protein
VYNVVGVVKRFLVSFSFFSTSWRTPIASRAGSGVKGAAKRAFIEDP